MNWKKTLKWFGFLLPTILLLFLAERTFHLIIEFGRLQTLLYHEELNREDYESQLKELAYIFEAQGVEIDKKKLLESIEEFEIQRREKLGIEIFIEEPKQRLQKPVIYSNRRIQFIFDEEDKLVEVKTVQNASAESY